MQFLCLLELGLHFSHLDSQLIFEDDAGVIDSILIGYEASVLLYEGLLFKPRL